MAKMFKLHGRFSNLLQRRDLTANDDSGHKCVGRIKPIMTTLHRKRIFTSVMRVSLCCLFLTTVLVVTAATRAARLPVAGKWERFEVKLKSDVVYTNPLHQAEINGIFVSPNGQRFVVPGFWDGGKTWRVRFSPNGPGKWIYRIVCTDTTNKGLHDQKGEFICTAPTGKTRFGQHGPVRVALDRKHLEHVDFTPFFWVGDAAWDAGRMATPKDECSCLVCPLLYYLFMC